VKGVILAAGKGTRMLPLTLTRPKPLVPLLDVPMLEHIILGMRSAGVNRVCVVVGHLQEMIREQLGDGSRLGVAVEYCAQERAGGTGDAVLHAAGFIGEDHFFLSWGDIMVAPPNYPAVAERYRAGGCEGVLGANRVDDPYQGAAVYQVGGYLSDIVEKPAKGTSASNHNNAGVFILPAAMVEVLRSVPLSPRGEIEMTSALLAYAAAAGRLAVHEIEGYWDDVARPANVIRLQATMLEFSHHDASAIADSAQIDPGAVLKPPVYIGHGAVVGAAVVGPNAVIGAGCSVADGCTLSDSACFAGAAVGAGSCAEHAILEMGARVSAGTSLTGSPAEPICVPAE